MQMKLTCVGKVLTNYIDKRKNMYVLHPQGHHEVVTQASILLDRTASSLDIAEIQSQTTCIIFKYIYGKLVR
jgi:hypothetical protein